MLLILWDQHTAVRLTWWLPKPNSLFSSCWHGPKKQQTGQPAHRPTGVMGQMGHDFGLVADSVLQLVMEPCTTPVLEQFWKHWGAIFPRVYVTGLELTAQSLARTVYTAFPPSSSQPWGNWGRPQMPGCPRVGHLLGILDGFCSFHLLSIRFWEEFQEHAPWWPAQTPRPWHAPHCPAQGLLKIQEAVGISCEF